MAPVVTSAEIGHTAAEVLAYATDPRITLKVERPQYSDYVRP